MTLIHGDCIEVMAGMDPESVDAICTDPPYGLEFMGKEWDGANGFRRSLNVADVGRDNVFGRTSSRAPEYRAPALYQQWSQQWAEAAYRVAKPSAYLLAFGGTRTVHRMTVALEDAGWIIRDMLVWAYASGFPKSKASLKPAWEPIVMARKPGPLRMLAIDECRIGTEGGMTRHTRSAGDHRDRWDGNVSTGEVTDHGGRWPANIVLTDPIFDGGVEGVVGGGETGLSAGGSRGVSSRIYGGGSGFTDAQPDFEPGYGDSGTYSRFFLIPKADRADREPVLGGLPERHSGVAIRAVEPGEYDEFVHPAPDGIGSWLRAERERAGLRQKDVAAHFPSKTGGLTGAVANWELEFNRPTPDQWRKLREVIGFDDRYDEVMTATRRQERANMGDGNEHDRLRLPAQRQNHHPTVKPTDLMRHLVRLVTPTGGVVLDPFLGSGTTALAAEMEGFEWIGIEREAEYVAIAEARLNGTQRGLGLETA